MIQINMKKKINQNLFALVVLIPLFFINMQSVHNWGDDFALYLHQAKNLVEGESPQETGLIYNEENPIMVDSVSIGFSILLSPVYAIWGDKIIAYSAYMTLFLLIAAIALLVFYRRRFPFWLSLILILLIVYNRWVLAFKYNILSDIPFFALLIIAFNLYEKEWKNKLVKFIILGLLAGFITSVRTLGVIFILSVIAITIYELISFRLKNGFAYKESKQRIWQLFLFCTVAVGFFKVLDVIFFPNPKEGSYVGYLQEHNIWQVFTAHINYYYIHFIGFFKTFKIAPFIRDINLIIVLVFLVGGFFVKLLRRIEIIDFFFIGFILIIFAYPANPGFRYLLPLIPFVFIYMTEGFTFLAQNLKMERKYLIAYIFFILLFAQYEPGIAHMSRPEKLEPIYGPQLPASEKVFNYIRQNTPDTAVFVFIKPRALSLYTDRQCMANNNNQRDADSLHQLYLKYRVDYLLENYNEIRDSALIAYLDKYVDKLEIVYSNNSFRLYKLSEQ